MLGFGHFPSGRQGYGPKKRRKRYPSHLSDGVWRYLGRFLFRQSHEASSAAAAVGRLREVSLRQVIQAIPYVLITGRHWRLLPRGFPPGARSTTTSTNGQVTAPGNALTTSGGRGYGKKGGITSPPPPAVWTAKASNVRLFPGSGATRLVKRGNGRKPPLFIDTLGLALMAMITMAGRPDPDGARQLLSRFPGSCWLNHSGRLSKSHERLT